MKASIFWAPGVRYLKSQISVCARKTFGGEDVTQLLPNSTTSHQPADLLRLGFRLREKLKQPKAYATKTCISSKLPMTKLEFSFIVSHFYIHILNHFFFNFQRIDSPEFENHQMLASAMPAFPTYGPLGKVPQLPWAFASGLPRALQEPSQVKNPVKQRKERWLMPRLSNSFCLSRTEQQGLRRQEVLLEKSWDWCIVQTFLVSPVTPRRKWRSLVFRLMI